MRIGIIMIILSICGLAYAQDPDVKSEKADSVRVAGRKVNHTPPQKNRTLAAQDTVEGELVLETIEIKGKVEKPGVIILPNRVQPELKKVELKRSFEKEVKEGVGEIIQPKKELREVEKVKSIKKTVGRKRK